jgi:hypothetical protein
MSDHCGHIVKRNWFYEKPFDPHVHSLPLIVLLGSINHPPGKQRSSGKNDQEQRQRQAMAFYTVKYQYPSPISI